MALQALAAPGLVRAGGSGWFCYPGKLKLPDRSEQSPDRPEQFRMVLLSGEVETMPVAAAKSGQVARFRMVLLSGEVETRSPSLRSG